MERLLPPFSDYSSSWVRSALLEQCKRHHQTGLSLSRYPYDAKKIYQVLWRRGVAFHLAQAIFEEQRRDDEFEDVFLPLIEADCNSVILEAAACEWLCIDPQDSIRHHLPGIPDTLSQGLVLKYYEPVLRMSCFISGITYRDEREGLSDRIINEAHAYAKRETIPKMQPVLDKDAVLRAIEQLHL